ncbi:MAG: hypothetical protein PQJ58_20785 [Spirochaetales bacterium]|nr:hypothetical protein [Spirochaetales bacterium]
MEEKRTDVPEYFRMESFRREEYLSQVGSFTQVQYQLFHNLCDFWDPALDYNQFILKSAKSFLASNNQLELLMGKLKAAHIGLLQYALIDGELKASRIVMTEKDDLLFYYYLGEDLLARQIHDNPHPYLTAKAYDDDGISLPSDMITPLETSMLSPGYAAENREPIIIGINRKMKAPLLIPSGMIEEFITALIGHIRSEAASPSVMENMSRIADVKISELQAGLGKRNPDFWINLCHKIQDQKEELKLRLKGLNPLFFTSAQLLHTYFQNTLTEMKQKEIEQREKKEALKEIIQEFREKETSWTHISLLDEKLKEKEEKWKGFREEFKTAVLVRGEDKEQPDLVLLNNMLMHKDFLFRYFTTSITELRKDLLFMYQGQMTDLLRHNRTDRYSQFFSRSNFRSDILTRVKEQELQLWELLQKPTRVAEAAFHYLQDIRGMKSSRVKDAMGLYFHSDLKSFRNVDTIFQLKLLTLFENSYKELGWFGRFILRLTGRYDSYISMFSDDPTAVSKRQSPSRRSRKKNKGVPGPSGVKNYSAKGPVERPYTPREKKKAWAEFDDAIHRQK